MSIETTIIFQVHGRVIDLICISPAGQGGRNDLGSHVFQEDTLQVNQVRALQ
jgi:hypothetical protein